MWRSAPRRLLVASSVALATASCCGCGDREDPGGPADAGVEVGGEVGDVLGDIADGPSTDATSSTCETGGDGPTTAPVAYTGAFAGSSGEQTATLTVSGLAREVFVYVPKSKGAKPPLLVALHGTAAGTDVGQGADMATRFEALADAHGVVVAGPEARLQPKGDWDQHSGGEKYWETIPSDEPARGCDPFRNPDLMLLRAIVQEARRAFDVDPKRIYLVGFSNGAFFSLAAAVALRDQVAAFMEMSGGLVTCDNTNSCSFVGASTTCKGLSAEPDYCTCAGTEKPIRLPTAGRMPPGNLTHGNQDYTVTVAYTCALAARMTALGHTFQMSIRGGTDHEVPDLTTPAGYEPVWAFFDGHPLP